MPVYTYRREDGSTFEIQQKFLDDPLTVDPETGQAVVRIIQPTGIIFKGSGFYVNDSRGASKKSISSSSNGNGNGHGSSETASSATGSESKAETKSESKSESSAVSSTAAD